MVQAQRTCVTLLSISEEDDLNELLVSMLNVLGCDMKITAFKKWTIINFSHYYTFLWE